MPKWKGKKVTQKRLKELKANTEFRRRMEMGKYGFMYQRPPYTIGGNKNSKVNYINTYY